jgi:hypothetical protein
VSPAASTADKVAQTIDGDLTGNEVIALADNWTVFESLALGWKVPFEKALIDIEDIQVEEYSQIRGAENRHRDARIEEFFLQMKNGALLDFPPLILMANDRSVIDANTRLAALLKLLAELRRDNPEVVIKAHVYLAHPESPRLARMLGAAMNQKGADRLSDEELRAAADDFVASGFPDDEIARQLGRTAEWARKFRKRSKFNDRVGSHPAADRISYPAAEKLVDITLDKPLTRVMDAVQQGARVDGPWAKKIRDAANEARTETDAVKAVDQVLQEMASTKTQGGNGRKPKVKASDILLKTIVQVESLTDVLGKLNTPLNTPMSDTFRTVLLALDDVAQAHLLRLGPAPVG